MHETHLHIKQTKQQERKMARLKAQGLATQGMHPGSLTAHGVIITPDMVMADPGSFGEIPAHGLVSKPRKLYPCVKKADIERESESIMYGLYSKGILIEEALKNLQIGAVKAAGRIRIKDLIEVLKL